MGGPVSLGEQIAEWLRAQIRRGKYEPEADPIPSEAWLQEEFGVSRPTVRKAVEILRREGLVYTVPQRGTYVSRTPSSSSSAGRRGPPKPAAAHNTDQPARGVRRRSNNSTGPPKSSRARTRLLLTDGGLRSCRHIWATRPLSHFLMNDIPYAGMHPHTGARQDLM